MDGSAIEEENERIAVESAQLLGEEIVDEADQDSSGDTCSPLRGCIDAGHQYFLAGTSSDHIVACCIFRSGGSLDVRRLTREEDRVAVHISLSLQSLIEEDDMTHTNPLNLASHLGDLLAKISRH